MEELEKKFYQELSTQLSRAKLLGYDSSHFSLKLEKLGPVAVMKQLAKKRQISEPFTALEALHHLELSPEAVASKARYAPLFTDEEADHFLAVLCESGYWG